MAVVTSFELVSEQSKRLHPTHVECHCTVVTSEDGNRYLQLDTHGSDERKMTGKLSQTLQFDGQRARQLKRILENILPD